MTPKLKESISTLSPLLQPHPNTTVIPQIEEEEEPDLADDYFRNRIGKDIESLCDLVILDSNHINALQFIPNDDPEHKNQIDHRNRIRDDYHIENLQWVSQTTNQMNKTSNRQIQYEYVSSIPDDAIVVNNYNEHKFENYYFHNDVFYFFNGIDYRKLHVIERKRGGLYVNMMNTRGVRICVYYSKFKKLYDLI